MLKDVRKDTRCYQIGNDTDFLFYRKGSGETIEIYDIAINSQRGVGRGAKLFWEMIEKAKPKRVFAITRRSNYGAQKFYESLNMEGVVLPRLYPDEDAIMYIWVSQ